MILYIEYHPLLHQKGTYTFHHFLPISHLKYDMVITIILFLSAKPSFSFNHIHTSLPSLIPALLSFHLLILLLNIINRIQSTIPCVIALFPIALSVIVIIHPLPETVIFCPSAYIPLMLPNKPSGAHYLHHPSHHSLQSYYARNWNYY